MVNSNKVLNRVRTPPPLHPRRHTHRNSLMCYLVMEETAAQPVPNITLTTTACLLLLRLSERFSHVQSEKLDPDSYDLLFGAGFSQHPISALLKCLTQEL